MSRLKRLEVVKMLVFSRHIEISAQDANTWDQKRWWLRKQYGVNAVLSCFCWCLHTLKQKSWCTAREEGGLMREKKGSDKDEREREREREKYEERSREMEERLVAWWRRQKERKEREGEERRENVEEEEEEEERCGVVFQVQRVNGHDATAIPPTVLAQKMKKTVGSQLLHVVS